MDDGEVILDLARVGQPRGSGWIDVMAETAAAEVDMEEVAPMVEVVGGKV